MSDNSTVPDPDLALAQQIVSAAISQNLNLRYAPGNWKNASNVAFAPTTNYLDAGTDSVDVNGHADMFSQTCVVLQKLNVGAVVDIWCRCCRIGQECERESSQVS